MNGWAADTRRYDLTLPGGLSGEVTWRTASPAWEWSARVQGVEIGTGRAATAVQAMTRCELILRAEITEAEVDGE